MASTYSSLLVPSVNHPRRTDFYLSLGFRNLASNDTADLTLPDAVPRSDVNLSLPQRMVGANSLNSR